MGQPRFTRAYVLSIINLQPSTTYYICTIVGPSLKGRRRLHVLAARASSSHGQGRKGTSTRHSDFLITNNNYNITHNGYHTLYVGSYTMHTSTTEWHVPCQGTCETVVPRISLRVQLLLPNVHKGLSVIKFSRAPRRKVAVL